MLKAIICSIAFCLMPMEEQAPPAPAPDPEAVHMLALTMWGEARGEGVEGMRAVGHVVINRQQDCGDTITEIVLRPYQFSIFNRGRRPRPERARGLDAERWDEARELAVQILSGRSVDPTEGARFYHERSIRPRWARRDQRVAFIGRHIFYRSA